MKKTLTAIALLFLSISADCKAAQVVSVEVINRYDRLLNGGVCEHMYADKINEKEKENLRDYLKALKGTKFEHPSMKYAKTADLSKFKISGLDFNDIATRKVKLSDYEPDMSFLKTITGDCWAHIPDAYRESFMFSDAKNGSWNTKYGYYCDNIVTETHTRRIYEDNCESRKRISYLNCLKSIDHADGLAKVEVMQACQANYQNFEDMFCQYREVPYTVTKCKGKGFLLGTNHYENIVSIVPFGLYNDQPSVSPDVRYLSYKQIVENLLKEYGPATVSIRRKNIKKNGCSGICDIHEFINTNVLQKECQTKNFVNFEKSDCQKLKTYYSDTYYWLDKPWMLRVQIIFPDGLEAIKDQSRVAYISTVYINWENFEAQDKYAAEILLQQKNNAK